MSSSTEVDAKQYHKARVATVQEWRSQNVAYPHKFQTNMNVAQFIDKYEHLVPGQYMEREEVRIAGRISRIASSSSKLRFYDMRSNGLRLQVFVNYEYHNSKSGDFNEIYNSIKRGDVVGIVGFPGRSKRGELSVFPRETMLLTPCLHMLPDKSGLKDPDTRYRQRYLDFIMNEDSMNVMHIRSRIVAFTRKFFSSRDFMEVETPTLNVQCGGASARPFISHHNELDIDLFLRVAPELPLKMIVVGGFEKVFEIGKCFRNEGIDMTHNPEFTSCEFYWAYADYNDLIELTEDYLSSLVLEIHGGYTFPYHPEGPEGPEIILDFKPPFERISLIDTLEREIGTTFTPPYNSEENCAKYREAIKNAGLEMPKPATPAKLLDKLVGHYIEDRIGNRPAFVMDHPQCMCPLSKWHRSRPDLCERFEVFICGRELINAYTELNDPFKQRECLQEQRKAREMGDDEAQDVDEGFCVALEYGLPPTAGWGAGIDRLTMFLSDRNNIKDVLFFPTMKPLPATNPTPNAPAEGKAADDAADAPAPSAGPTEGDKRESL
ncbi:lysyl-tRNA synthetase, putative [Babesia bigemina]|uniref:Lysine--tRNA ligase n=1 Tax=Babesia bigemina TaxID=5866 RepID=A0A061DAS4_BABBI|nr:lysyl-tRNA synthetase, putative [Babesia bigemina]CDR96019.1 lysyl-tRNA synthetase, putative [Babesia bigemina]|eukprot:XP_012768205.1 lysyl-tRNA synthetase, putative [Babesia bigemina]